MMHLKLDYRFIAPLYRILRLALLVVVLMGLASIEVTAQDAKQKSGDSGTEHGTMGELGAKLANPLSDVWALFTEFDWNFKKGDITDGSYKNGYAMLFQPVLPIPLTESWKLITRPVVPVISTEIPQLSATGDIDFDRESGLGDIQLPLVFVPKAKEGSKWMWGAGPTFIFPTATNDDLGAEKWQAGPAVALVYKTKKLTTGVFPQYWWDFAGWGDESTSGGALVYFYFYNLPQAWQIGTNPTIIYNNEAKPDNRWNVPIGLTVAKTTKIGKLPIKFQFGGEYSVVHEEDYGKRWQIKLNIIPVIPALFKNPIFGK